MYRELFDVLDIPILEATMCHNVYDSDVIHCNDKSVIFRLGWLNPCSLFATLIPWYGRYTLAFFTFQKTYKS